MSKLTQWDRDAQAAISRRNTMNKKHRFSIHQSKDIGDSYIYDHYLQEIAFKGPRLYAEKVLRNIQTYL